VAAASRASPRRAPSGVLVGHVTKEGMIAGPSCSSTGGLGPVPGRGAGSTTLRACGEQEPLRDIAELALFSMTDRGSSAVRNPRVVAEDRPRGRTGLVVAAALEGSTPLLVEVQALVTASTSPPRGGSRPASTRRGSPSSSPSSSATPGGFATHDVFVNLAGGLSCASRRSTSRSLSPCSRAPPTAPCAGVSVCGEIGLLGECGGQPRRRNGCASARLGLRPRALPARNLTAPRSLSPPAVSSVSELRPPAGVASAVSRQLPPPAPTREREGWGS